MRFERRTRPRSRIAAVLVLGLLGAAIAAEVGLG
jgi:hypothetical protein